MKKFLLTIVYATISSILLLLLKNFFGIGNSWWIDGIIIIVSLFIGISMFAQFHGTQVYQLKHLGSIGGTNKFQVTLKVSGHGIINIVGEYTRLDSYADLELQSKIFKVLNSSPGNKQISEFSSNTEENALLILVEDPDMPHPINLTQIRLEKYESDGTIRANPRGVPTRAEIEKGMEGMSRYEIGMKLWEQEQELLEKARKDGVEDELIAYWESQGRPRMKKPPTKED